MKPAQIRLWRRYSINIPMLGLYVHETAIIDVTQIEKNPLIEHFQIQWNKEVVTLD